MIINYTKSYNYKIERDHYIIYGCPDFKNTNVFHEYYDVIMKCPDVNKLGLIEMIKTLKPKSSGGIRILYNENNIQFLKPLRWNRTPEFYIEFQKPDELDKFITYEHPNNIVVENLPVCGYITDEIGQFDFTTRNFPSRPQFVPGQMSYKKKN